MFRESGTILLYSIQPLGGEGCFPQANKSMTSKNNHYVRTHPPRSEGPGHDFNSWRVLYRVGYVLWFRGLGRIG